MTLKGLQDNVSGYKCEASTACKYAHVEMSLMTLDYDFLIGMIIRVKRKYYRE